MSNPVELSLAVQEALPQLAEDPAAAHVPLRGSLEGSFGETHLVFTAAGRLYAASKTSALAPFEATELDASHIPRLVSDRWGDALQVVDSAGAVGTIQLDSLARERTLQRLAALYRERGAWDELAQTLRLRIEATYDTHQRDVLQLEHASLMATQLGRPEEALAVYERILLHEPEQAVALEGLTRLFF